MPTNRSIDPCPAGMGDAIVGLWIAEGARSVGEKIVFVDGGYSDIIRAFGHEVVPERTEDCMVLGSGSVVYEEEMRTSATDQSSRIERWQKTLGWEYPGVRPKIHHLQEEAVNWANAMHDGRPMVIIAPKANYESRSMPMQKWLRIAWSLERAGIRVIAIDGQQSAVQAFPFYAYGFNWQHTLALLAKSDVVAGNDSGIPHAAATLGIPTIVAIGPTNADIVFGHCRDALTTLVADNIECQGCHFRPEKGYQVACDHGCDALQSLSWKAIESKIHTILGSRQLVPI